MKKRKQHGGLYSGWHIKNTLCSRFIVTSYVSIVVSVILISIVSYALLSENSWKYMVQTSEQIVRQKKSGIEIRLEGLETTFRDVAYHTQVQKLLSSGKEASDLNALRVEMNQAITGVANSFMMFDNMVVFSADGNMVGSLLGFDTAKKAKDYSWYQEASESGGETVWLPDLVQTAWDNYGGHVTIPVVKKIRALHASGNVPIGKTLGYFYGVLNLDQVLNFVQNEYQYPADGHKVLIVAADGKIISSIEKRGIGDKFDTSFFHADCNNTYISYQGEKVLFTYTEVPSESFYWYVVCITPKREILKDAHMAVFVCFCVSFVLLLVFLFFSIHNARAIRAPFKVLEDEFEKVEQGEFDLKIHEKFHIMEIDRLFQRFHVMVYRLDTLIREVYEARIKEQKLQNDAREAEIQALQMQINPHFLYNTLDSINWMALMQGNKEISKMALALGHLFRANMNTTGISGIYTTVEEELENIRLFMYLEQVRFEEKLDYMIDADESVMKARIVKHIIQPLVENSIKYGIEPYNIRGKIEILVSSVKREGAGNEADDTSITIIVADNGKGMKPEKCEELTRLWEQISHNQDVEEDGKKKKNGVGIRNIMMRLHLCYGEKAEFSVCSSEEKGTVTKISFPMK
ncbi:MAG: histidine kinase [bacterium]|nr:histidine kinase [bacterium]